MFNKKLEMYSYTSALITVKSELPDCLKNVRQIFCFQFLYFEKFFGWNMLVTVIPSAVWDGKVYLTNMAESIRAISKKMSQKCDIGGQK